MLQTIDDPGTGLRPNQPNMAMTSMDSSQGARTAVVVVHAPGQNGNRETSRPAGDFAVHPAIS